ncbi:hypothetical protein ACERII_16725 [Evansella sp. AB-rgal1]|uniref:hypothetical protein n=1 Tax=Evansella sp. AB-rgal1 TaxID=3242696 RepID=UPI00359DE658
MLDVIGLEILKAFGRLWLHPLTYIFILAAFFIGLKRVKRERKDFHTRVYDVIHELTSPVMIGIGFGLILSIIFTVVGMEISVGMMVLITALWLLFLPFRKIRWLSMTFIASFALIISGFLPNGGTNYEFLNDWLVQINSMNLVGFAWIVVALFLSEALLVMINGWKETSPKLLKSKRGKTVGSHEAKKLWPIPILLLLPIGNLSYEGWWPLFPSANSSEFGLMLIPFILGFQLTVQSQYPKTGMKKLGKQLLILSVMLAVVAGVASYFSIILLAVPVIGLLGREFIYMKFINSEKQKTSYFKHIEKGLTVLGVLPHSTAEKMGIEVGEVISKVNGYEVFSQRDIYEALQLNSAYCKLEVLDREGERRFAQSSIHEGDHYHIGLLFIPDGEMTNLSARGLRSSVVVHNDRNGGSLTANVLLNKDSESSIKDANATEDELSIISNENEGDFTNQEEEDSFPIKEEISPIEELTLTNEVGAEQAEEERNFSNITDDVIEAIESLPTRMDKKEDYPKVDVDKYKAIETESVIDEEEVAAIRDDEVISELSKHKDTFQKNVEVEERRAESGDSPYGQAAGLNAFYEEFRKTVTNRDTWKPKVEDNNEKSKQKNKKQNKEDNE